MWLHVAYITLCCEITIRYILPTHELLFITYVSRNGWNLGNNFCMARTQYHDRPINFEGTTIVCVFRCIYFEVNFQIKIYFMYLPTYKSL